MLLSRDNQKANRNTSGRNSAHRASKRARGFRERIEVTVEVDRSPAIFITNRLR